MSIGSVEMLCLRKSQTKGVAALTKYAWRGGNSTGGSNPSPPASSYQKALVTMLNLRLVF